MEDYDEVYEPKPKIPDRTTSMVRKVDYNQLIEQDEEDTLITKPNVPRRDSNLQRLNIWNTLMGYVHNGKYDAYKNEVFERRISWDSVFSKK